MSSPYTVTGETKEFISQHEQCDLVRVLTCGSVDDGKSTLIGRLFLDAKVLPGDTLAALEADSKKHGTQNGEIDPALLIDGLSAEREQKITIDVAHRYFSTDVRTFIIADSPGHEQYTRNMVTAASKADIVVILLDARNGVQQQTRRHAFIASLLGIKHAIIAVNKMDLVEYSEDVFMQIKRDFLEFTERLQITDLHFVPVAALLGDNVISPSASMPWYQGGTLLHLLNSMHIVSDKNAIDFRFPVQYVSRPTSDYRGYAGTIASGAVRPGDEVVVLPSHMTSRVKSIDTFEGPRERATVMQAVTLTLEDNVDVSRGDMIVPVHNVPEQRKEFDAMLVWMDSAQLSTVTDYVLKHTTTTTSARVRTVRYRMDVNTLRRADASTLALNDIGRCALSVSQPLAVDSYERNRQTGAFILIDPITNKTVAAGMVLNRRAEDTESSDASIKQMQTLPIVWLTGNTGAGKSTLASAAESALNKTAPSWHPAARKLVVLDGDEMRETISIHEDLSPEGRTSHNLRVARLAALLQQKGFLVVVSVIAPFEQLRQQIDEICSPHWVYVKTEGITSPDKPYEEPASPDLVIDNDALSHEEASQTFVDFVLSLLKG